MDRSRDPLTRGPFLTTLMRMHGAGGAHAEVARQVVFWLLVAEALAASGHDGPPHAAWGTPRGDRAPRVRKVARSSLTGRRPRG